MTIFFICGLLVTVSFPVTASEVFKVDPVHSAITFRVKHLGISFVHGRFNNATGTITFDEKVSGSSSIKVSVKVADIDTSNAERDEDLKSKKFFDAEKYRHYTKDAFCFHDARLNRIYIDMKLKICTP